MADINELRRQVLMKRVEAKRASAQPKEETGGVGDFVNSMALGSSIGENLPLVGKPIADLGTKIGSGIEAAAEATFGNGKGTIGQLYDRNMAASKTAEDERSAYDEKSPMAQTVKSNLAAVALPGIKTAKPIAAAENMALQGGEKFGVGSNGAIRSMDEIAPTRMEKMGEFLSKKYEKTKGPLMNMAKDSAEDMLPYPMRMYLRYSRRFKGE